MKAADWKSSKRLPKYLLQLIYSLAMDIIIMALPVFVRLVVAEVL